jgi:hypothetical protein
MIPLNFGFKSHSENDQFGHWSAKMTATTRWNRADVLGRLPWNLKVALDRHSALLPHSSVLTSGYINGHTYGVEGYFHKDAAAFGHSTVILYLNKVWEPDWAGETCFLNDYGDIFQSVLPKPGRMVAFDSSIKHCARGVSRMCPDLRKTLVLKYRPRKDELYEKVCHFLTQTGAIDQYMKDDRNGRSQHDVGMDLYEFLVEHGFYSYLIRFAAVASILDQRVHGSRISENTDKTTAEFCELVANTTMSEVNEYLHGGPLIVRDRTYLACSMADLITLVVLAKYQVETGLPLNPIQLDFWNRQQSKPSVLPLS